MVNPFYAASGLIVGVLIGLTGVGGGSLMTPILIVAFGMHPAGAVGTDLLYAAITKGVGTAVHGFGKNIEWKIVRLLAAGSVPSALLTVTVLSRFGANSPLATATISTVLGIALLVTAATIPARTAIVRWAVRFAPDPSATRTSSSLTVLIGALVGVLVSLSSVGAGALVATALVFLYPRLPVARIVGSDVAHAVPLTLLAGVGHWLLGEVHFPVLASLLVGSIPGIIIGSLTIRFVPERALRLILASALFLAGIKLLA